jgi:hypothetical protein
MALNDATFITELTLAFNQELWSDCADKLATAIDNYCKTGILNTVVNGTVTPPGFPIIPSYPASGSGVGSVQTIGPSAMKAAFTAAWLNTLWSPTAPPIADAIESHAQSFIIPTVVSGVLNGTGQKVSILTAPLKAALISGLQSAFLNTLWSGNVTQFQSSIKTFIIGSVVSTSDLGTTPPVSWVGTGTGVIS